MAKKQCYNFIAIRYYEGGGNPPIPSIPNDEVWYTTTDGNTISPGVNNAFGVSIVSNTYVNGKGVFKLSGEATELKDYALQNIAQLSSITIPSSVRSLGFRSLAYNSSLTSIYIKKDTPPTNYQAFEEMASGCKIYVPIGAREAYIAATNWSNIAEIIEEANF